MSENLQDFVGRLQKQCCEWGAYWRASDAHGVDLSAEQAEELLRDVLGVEVNIARTACAERDARIAELEAVAKVALADLETASSFVSLKARNRAPSTIKALRAALKGATP